MKKQKKIDMLECDKENLQLELDFSEKKILAVNLAISLINKMQTGNDLDALISYLKNKETNYSKTSEQLTLAFNLQTMINHLTDKPFCTSKGVLEYLNTLTYDVILETEKSEDIANDIIMTDHMKAMKLDRIGKN